MAELERLGVLITSCAFADAEEHLETEPTDLVALAGALGAVELANMIDDLDDGPRMVIVAERKELAKLRGLNREVVVSLFAMETTEKVVGQRIESLARRAARRREHKAAPDAKPLKKTALGLPSAAQVAKVDLKKMEAPPSVRPKPPPVEEDNPPSSGHHPATEPVSPVAREEVPMPIEEKASSDQQIPKAPRKPAPPRRADPPKADPPKPDQGKPPKAEAPKAAPPKAEPPKAEPPKPPLPARSSREDAEQSIMVIDEDLLESILPDAPGGDIPEISAIPMMSAIPDPQDAPMSHPPTLPPAAKAQSSRGAAIQFKAAPQELDITDAESALENLDSVKLEITPDLVEHAQKEMGSSAPDPYDEDTVVGHVEGGGLPVGDEPADEQAADAAKELDTTALSFDKTLPLEAASAGAELAIKEEEPENEAVGGAASDGGEDTATFELETPSEPADEGSPPGGGAPKASTVNGGQSFAEGAAVVDAFPGASKRKGGGVKAVGLIALVAAALGGVYAYQSGHLGDQGGAHPESQAATQPAKETPTGPEAVPPSHARSEELPGASGKDSDGHKTPDSTADAATEDAAQQGDENPAPSSVSESLDNPFKRPLVAAPSCDSLVAANPPDKGDDLVHLASVAWDQARAAIVGGNLKDAHLYMCQAVELNPESMAIEGLAGHFLALGDYEKALKWAEKADALRPGQMDIGNLKGDVYAMMGDVDKARAIWLDKLNIGPDQYARLVPISKDYSVEAGRHLRRGDLVRAELFFRRAVILDRDNLNGIIGLAKVYHRLEMPSFARAFSEMSLEVSDVIPEVHVLLGELALADGKKDEAKARFERALEVRPGFFPAKRGLSQVK